MTKERFEFVMNKINECRKDEELYDVDMLSEDLLKLDVSVEEAFIICLNVFDMNHLLTFNYKNTSFFTDEQNKIIEHSFSFNN